MGNANRIPAAALKQYDLIVSKIPGMERKGKGSPYTSMNGNMYTMMRKDGALGIRLSKEDRESFMEKFDAVPFENYGSMIREYVEVPESVLMDTEIMVEYMIKSHDYAKTLKPKSTKRAAKPASKSRRKAEAKKVTQYVGETYKNGQPKAEIKGEFLIFYFEDGTIKAKGKIRNEKMEGKWVFYKKGGHLWQTAYFSADVKNGELIRYDSKGEIAYHVIFKNGKVVEKMG